MVNGMLRLGLSSSVFAALFALAACASPEAEIATTAAAPLAEAPAVEASITPMAPQGVLIQVADAEDALVLPVNYSCAEGRSFIATFPEHGTSVTIAAAGETRVLASKGKAEDFIFADASGATLSAEGAGAALTGLGDAPYLDCMAG